jgi:hypothetical protein
MQLPEMSDRSEDQEFTMRVSRAFAEGDDEYLSNLFGWDEVDTSVEDEE